VNGDGPDGLETGTVERMGHSPGRDGRGEHGRGAILSRSSSSTTAKVTSSKTLTSRPAARWRICSRSSSAQVRR
jgi:hypothetical protein